MDTPAGWGLFAGWLLKSSAQAALLVVLVLVVQWLLRRWLTPRWRYFLWWLVVARLLMPVSLPGPVSIFNWVKWNSPPAPAMTVMPITPEVALPASPPDNFATAIEETTPALPAQSPVIIAAPAPTAPMRPPFDWRLGVMWLWLAGAALLGARLVWSLLRLRRELRTATPVEDPTVLALLDDCRAQMQVRDRLTLLETPLVNSPALCGFWRPRLLLPPGLCGGFSASQLRFIFLHELAHMRRHDIAVNWLTALLQILHWFNPLVWLAFARLRADRELACDALALSVAAPGEQHAYGQTIIRLLEGFARPSAMPGLVGILEDKNQMKRRIRMIAQFRRPGRWAWLSGIAAAILGIVCLTDAQTPKAKEAKPLVIRIESKQPHLYLDDSPVTVENLQKELTARAASNPNLEVELRIEKLAPFGVIAEVVDATKAAKVKAVGARIQEADSAKPSGAATTSATVGSAQAEVQPSPEHRVCTVVGPDGKPVNHAAVGFCIEREPVVLKKAHPIQNGVQGWVRYTDAQGKVEVPVDDEIYRIVAVHDVGFGEVGLADLRRMSEIRLRPWGRVEGTWRNAAKATEVGLVALNQGQFRPYVFLSDVNAAPSDAAMQGRFSFDKVPPGELKVCRLIKTDVGRWSHSHEIPIIVRPGETTQVELGNEGSSVKGQFIAADSVKPINLQRMPSIAQLSIPMPDVSRPPASIAGSPAASRAWQAGFWESEAGRAWLRKSRTFALVVAPDGSFTCEDIPPGEYILRVTLAPTPFGPERPTGLKTNVVIVAPAASAVNEPIDLGTFVIPPPKSKPFPASGNTGGNDSAKAEGQVKIEGKDTASTEHSSLSSKLRISGTVTDAETKLPIENFSVTQGRDYWVNPAPADTTEERDGRFDIAIREPGNSFAVRIEAEGYQMAESEWFRPGDGSRKLSFGLQKIAKPICSVLTPDGKPAGKATVCFCSDQTGAILGQAEILHRGWAAARDADTQGKVVIPPNVPAHRAVFVHKSGFAEIPMAKLRGMAEVRLQPWGRIEGTLRNGNKPGTNESVGLSALLQSAYRRYWSLGPEAFIAQTDEKGHFVFENVPPSEVLVSRMIGNRDLGQTYSHSLPVKVKPGETTRVDFGGTGVRVEGRLDFTNPSRPVDVDQLAVMANLNPPRSEPPQRPSMVGTNATSAQKWLADFWETEAGLEWLRQRRGYSLTMTPEGNLVGVDVPPGNYTLSVRVGRKTPQRPAFDDMLGIFQTNVVVAPSGGGDSGAAVNLGTFSIKVANLIQRGDASPSFEATTLDGQPLRLADFHGKYVLLDFWGTSNWQSMADLPELKAVQDEFGKDSRFVMISLSIDKDIATVREFVKKHGLNWRQGFLEGTAKTEVMDDFGVTGIPALFLIGPDGKMISSGRGFRAEHVLPTLKHLLRRDE